MTDFEPFSSVSFDPIRSIMITRNSIAAANLHYQEFHNQDWQIIALLEDALNEVNYLHRWLMRNPQFIQLNHEAKGAFSL